MNDEKIFINECLINEGENFHKNSAISSLNQKFAFKYDKQSKQ